MRSVKTIVKIILISLGASTVFWTIESMICTWLEEGNFLGHFLNPGYHNLYVRVACGIMCVPIVTLSVFLGRKSAEVKLLRGLIPICAWCGKKIRDEKGNWKRVEEYITERSTAEFTHGMCPECQNKYFTEEDSKENINQ